MIVPTPLGRSKRKIHSSCHYGDKDFSFSRGNWGPEREGPSSASLSQVSHGDPTESEEVTLITICPVLSPWAPSCSHVQKFWTFYLHSTRLPVTYSKNSQWGYEAIPAYTPTDGHPKLDIPLPRTLCQPPSCARVIHSFLWAIRASGCQQRSQNPRAKNFKTLSSFAFY